MKSEEIKSSKSWTYQDIAAVYDKKLIDLVFAAASVHRKNFDPHKVQVSSLISVKTGGCPEDCHYCPQSARYQTGVGRQGMLETEDVLKMAKRAKEEGSSRVCLGAAWRKVQDNKHFDTVVEMVQKINSMGMEVCCTLGMLDKHQALRLKEAGLYAYNHNIDTSREHYDEVITTRSYDDRLNTLENVREAKLTVCSGGIIGLGEKKEDRIKMLLTLSSLEKAPESIPINTLVAVKGTPLENQEVVSFWSLLRMIATARIVFPKSHIRLSAGRLERSASEQALCFLAGANSIFSGEKLLTTPNCDSKEDKDLFAALGLSASRPFEQQA